MTGCLETLLEHSRAQYLDLLDQLRELADESGPEQIERLLELQQQARNTDAELVSLLQAGPGWGAGNRVRQRLELLEAVLEEQRRLMPVLLGRKAILAAELGQLRTGQVAMSGYRMAGDQRGFLLCRAG